MLTPGVRGSGPKRTCMYEGLGKTEEREEERDTWGKGRGVQPRRWMPWVKGSGLPILTHFLVFKFSIYRVSRLIYHHKITI